MRGNHTRIETPEALGAAVRLSRRRLGVTQAQAAGLSQVGTRFLSELERGKPTLQWGKVLQVLAAFGLELTLRPRGPRG